MNVGDTFPDFELFAHNGEIIKSNDLKGTPIVIFTYPRAMTSGCTKEVCSVRDYFSEIKQKGVIPFGLSNDPIDKNKKFAEKHNIQYLLLSDPESKLLREIGAFGIKKMYGKEYEGTKRQTFIIDKNFKVIKIFKKVKTAIHGEEILNALNELGI